MPESSEPTGAIETGPRRKGRPRDASADERILAAAAELILQRGYDNMTVDEVAAKAKAGKATVYRRWAGKEDLAFAAIAQLYSTEFPIPDTGTVLGDLREAYRQGLEFAGSEAGGERAAAIYSVIETAKMNGLEPQAYITDVIGKIAADWPAARWDELLPWNWQPPLDQPIAQAA